MTRLRLYDTLIDVLTSCITPDSWPTASGPGPFDIFDGSLVLRADDELDASVRATLEAIRVDVDAWRMIRRRAKAAGITTPIGNHTTRGTRITNYMKNGGEPKEAQKMAAHVDPRTTGLYDRSGDDVSLDEIEQINI